MHPHDQVAFDDRVAAVHDTGIGPGALARALVWAWSATLMPKLRLLRCVRRGW
ncbi:hypothetical protein [Mycolicibacterium hodleri]|uniref:hypothetical protein n=1 Tax=Mycolicibacterium hodleri TaxID=49897 RepID=UPI0013761ACE|nr:hypothetical protein [Mycolicibacterium hodleri]